MLRPIAEVTDPVHHPVRQSILMLGNKIYHRMIEVERCHDRDRGNNDADQPIKNGLAIHK